MSYELPKPRELFEALIGLCSVKCVYDVMKRYRDNGLAIIINCITNAAIEKLPSVENDTEVKDA